MIKTQLPNIWLEKLNAPKKIYKYNKYIVES